MCWRSVAAIVLLGAGLSCERSGPEPGVNTTGAAGTGSVAVGGAGGSSATGAGGAMTAGAGGGAGTGVSTVAPAAFEYNGSVSIVREK